MESLRSNQYPQIIILHFFLWQSKWENWGQKGFLVILVGNVINTCILSCMIESYPVNSCCCTFQHIVSKNMHWQQFCYAVEMVEKNLEDIYPRYFTASNQTHPVLESCRSKADWFGFLWKCIHSNHVLNGSFFHRTSERAEQLFSSVPIWDENHIIAISLFFNFLKINFEVRLL